MWGDMFVELLHYTPIDVAIYAIRTCYNSYANSDSMRQGGEFILGEKDKALIERIIKNGHTSTLEHLNYSYNIQGISRACSLQLVRHRIASYSQESQRYVKFDKDTFIIPETIENNDEAKALYMNFNNICLSVYRRLIDAGVPKEDARFVLSNAATTNLVMTINARSLINFFTLRLDKKSQWEIRVLAGKMLNILPKEHRFIFDTALNVEVKG